MSPLKVLVTGAQGFVGRYLVQALLRHEHEVVTAGHRCAYDIDLTDKLAVFRCMKEVRPDAVVHLAAVSNVPYAWEHPAQAVEVNVSASTYLLEAFAQVQPQGTFLFVGSSDAYGLTAKAGRPLVETDLCQPQNPYAISKLCAEQMMLQLGHRLGVRVLATRSFNHFGPGQAKGFVVSDFASQIAAVERGEQEPVLRVGDLSAARDFTFVTDVVAAYVALLETKGIAPGIYNVCSGQTHEIYEVIDGLLQFSLVKIKVAKDPERFRPSEVPRFVGSAKKLQEATGWRPRVPFLEGLGRVLEDWRQRVE